MINQNQKKRKLIEVKITLSTIAHDLGLSTATVSLALRDSPLITEQTKKIIRKKAKEIGYVYDRRAAGLRTKKSGIVGVIVRDIINPFFAEILGSIETELGSNRQTFILCNHHDNISQQNEFISTLMQFGADGVIMSPSIGTTKNDIKKIEQNGLPVVFVARTVEGADVPAFLGNDVAGFKMVTEYLIDQGHRDIMIVGGTKKTSTGRARRQGFLDAFKQLKINKPKRKDIETPYSRTAAFEVTTKIIKQKNMPTAIACCSDTIAIGVMHALRQNNIEPGKDIAVTGYDDIAEASICAPALTTVSDGHAEMGRLAARALISKIRGDQQKNQNVMINPLLKVRKSAQPPKK